MEWIIGILLAALVVVLVSIIRNRKIDTTAITYDNPRIPAAFDGYTILHISDFHNARFGNDQATLMTKIRRANADIMVITGDLLDRRHPDMPVAVDFARQLARLAPVYFVSGNHEIRSGHREELLEQLMDAGVVLLDDRMEMLEKHGARVELYGLMDPFDAGVPALDKRLKGLTAGRPVDGVKLLLCHRPELLPVYATHGIDLAFAGHAHGGLVRLPGIKGLIAPNQGFFPKYTAGAYTLNATTLVVSRGLGTNLMPLRIGNPPELVLVTLRAAKAEDSGKN